MSFSLTYFYYTKIQSIMNPLERRNMLTNKINSLKAELDGADFMRKLELKDEILELEKELGTAKLYDGDSDECEMCGS